MRDLSKIICKSIRQTILGGAVVAAMLVAMEFSYRARAANPDAAAIGSDTPKTTVREYDITDLLVNQRRAVVNMAITAPATEPSDFDIPSIEVQARDVVRKLENTIEYDSWLDPYSKASVTIETTRDTAKLIISQTPAIQAEVAGLFDKMREYREQINLDAHVISIAPSAGDSAAMLRQKISGAPAPGSGIISATDADAILKILRATNDVTIRDIKSSFKPGVGTLSATQTIHADEASGDSFEVIQGAPTADRKIVALDLQFQWTRFERWQPAPANATTGDVAIDQLAELKQRVVIPNGRVMLVAVPAPQLVTATMSNPPTTQPFADSGKPALNAIFLLVGANIVHPEIPAAMPTNFEPHQN